MKRALAAALMLLAGAVFAQEINEAVKPEVMEQMTPGQRDTARLTLKVGRAVFIEPNVEGPAPEATDADKAAGFVLFLRRYMDTINYNSVPLKGEINPATVSVTAAIGETEPLTFGIYPLEAVDVKVGVSDLVNESGAKFSKDNFEIRSVKYLLKTVNEGMWQVCPEKLARENPVKVLKDVTRRVWITVNTPKDAAPGTYKGKITFKASGKTEKNVDITLTVLPFTLMANPEFEFGWFGAPMEGPALETYLRYENTYLPNIDPKIKAVSGGHVTLDMTGAEKVAALVKKIGVEKQIQLCQMIGQANELIHTYKLKEFSPEFNTAYKDIISQVNAWAKAKGLRVAYYIVDEPREAALNPWNRNFSDTMRYAKLVKEVPDSMSFLDAADANGTTDYTPFVDAVDISCPGLNRDSIKTCDKANKLGKHLWLYNSGHDRLTYGFMPWNRKAEARIEWAWNSGWDEKVSTDPRSWATFISGDPACGAYYPVGNEILPTPSLELSREGIHDYKYCWTLEQLIKQAEDSKKPEAVAAAKSASAVVDALKKKIPLTNGGDVNYTVVKIDMSKLNGELDGWRAAVIAEILKLKKAL